MDKITLSHAVVLFEELIANGSRGSHPLCCWFRDEKELIVETLNSLKTEEEEGTA